MSEGEMAAGAGLCECGCGTPTAIARTTNRPRGHIKGQPLRFVRFHAGYRGPKMSGPQNANWRGGVTRMSQGYVGEYAPSHPRASKAGYVMQHILVVERLTGVAVVPPMEIHHVNGDKRDNRPENLVLCPDGNYHKLLHQRQKALDAGFPAHYRVCTACHLFDDPMKMSRHGHSFRHTPNCGGRNV